MNRTTCMLRTRRRRNRRGAPPAKSQPAPPTTRAASKLKSRNWDVPVTGDDDNDEDNLAVSEPIGQVRSLACVRAA